MRRERRGEVKSRRSFRTVEMDVLPVVVSGSGGSETGGPSPVIVEVDRRDDQRDGVGYGG